MVTGGSYRAGCLDCILQQTGSTYGAIDVWFKTDVSLIFTVLKVTNRIRVSVIHSARTSPD